MINDTLSQKKKAMSKEINFLVFFLIFFLPLFGFGRTTKPQFCFYTTLCLFLQDKMI